jgi:hypothetical protein
MPVRQFGFSPHHLPAWANVIRRAMHGTMNHLLLVVGCARQGFANVCKCALKDLPTKRGPLRSFQRFGFAWLPRNDCTVFARLADVELAHVCSPWLRLRLAGVEIM